MVKLADWIWEGLSTEEKPGNMQGSKDGHIFKELDTGESYTRKAGVWENINLGLSFIKATKSDIVQTNGDGYAHITFNTPFISNEYAITHGIYAGPYSVCSSIDKDTQTKDGFDIYTRYSQNGSSAPNVFVAWVATRNYNP
jgi:hypothetical protein